MRIISGNRRGRKIHLPAFFKDRPTTDFAKESLFNILGNNYYLEDVSFLDLFTGTGSISYEFASRGCKNLTAIDLNRKYAMFVEREFEKMYPNENFYTILNEDSLKFITNRPLNYDIIFADPPYDIPELSQIPDMVFANQNLKDEVLLVLEHSAKNNFSDHKHFWKHKKYGSVNFTFFRK